MVQLHTKACTKLPEFKNKAHKKNPLFKNEVYKTSVESWPMNIEVNYKTAYASFLMHGPKRYFLSKLKNKNSNSKLKTKAFLFIIKI